MKTTDGELKVNWKHFLQVYNPLLPRQLLVNEMSAKSDADIITSSEENAIAASAVLKRAATASAAVRSTQQHVQVESKRLWQAALRECQKFDPDRLGLIPRAEFVKIMEQATVGKVRSYLMNHRSYF